MPTGKNLPSFFSDFKFRARIQWRGLKSNLQDTLSAYIAYKWQIYRSMPSDIPKPKRPTVDIRTIVPVAMKLHKQMYTAFAKGDVKVLEDICTEGVRLQYLNKIAKRAEKDEKMAWELISYKTKPKLWSMKAGGSPVELKGIPVGIQQAAVRIVSLQRLTTGNVMGARVAGSKATSKENIVWKEPKEKEVTEYLVVQRRLLEGKYEPWKVWGFVKEFDVAAEKKELEGDSSSIMSEGGGITTPRMRGASGS
jgi:protein MBA1